MKRIAFFIAEGFQALDLFGPLDAFDEVNSLGSRAYSSDILSFQSGPVKTASGHSVYADKGITEVQSVDYLVICGGSGMRKLKLSEKQRQQLRCLADKADKVISICTGAFVLAQIYMEQSLTLTTHWRHCQELATAHHNTHVKADPLYIEGERVWSSAGVLSGVDLALALIRQDMGNTMAAAVARELVVYMQRKGTQNQFSDLLHVQASDSLRLAPLIEWLNENLDKSVSVTDMADVASVSERQLSRLFAAHLGQSPARYLNQLRLNRARDLMRDDNRALAQIARQVGFSTYDSFRRAFERYFGIAPSSYQL